MLTLTRTIGQKVRIGDDIEVVVLEVRGSNVRLGFTAPRGITIHREEIYQRSIETGTEAETSPSGSGALSAEQSRPRRYRKGREQH